MACKEASGYDLDWVEDPPDDLKCLICLCVARDPQQHPGDARNPCGKIFCNDCITKYQKDKTTCPNCRQNLTLFLDSRSARDIMALKVKCNNLTNSCDWMGELGSLETHQQSCDYTLISCTNQCTIQGVVPGFLKKDLSNHLANDCPRRQYECPHCQETGEHQERTTSHFKTCQKVKIQCPNTGCQDTFVRCDVDTHRSTCPYEPMSCKYAAVGCKEKPLRKDIEVHEEDDQLHLRVTTNKILQLTKCVLNLSGNVEQLTRDVQKLAEIKSHLLKSTSLTPCTLNLTNYQQSKSNKKTFFGPPFYSSYSGYKMCFRFDYSDVTGTHVSVYAHLMKGDHDDTLTWPFTGSVTVELLNQLENKNHYKKIIIFRADHDVSERVTDRERARFGRGLPKFISHADLSYNATTNTQYLKDDTLVFRVSVKVPDHKPWLDCTV